MPGGAAAVRRASLLAAVVIDGAINSVRKVLSHQEAPKA